MATKLSNNLTCLSEALSTQYSPDTTLALLQTSTAQAEEEAEVRNSCCCILQRYDKKTRRLISLVNGCGMMTSHERNLFP